MGYSPWSRKELDTTERLHFHFPFLLFTIHSVNKSSKADQPSSTHGVKNGPFISFNTSRYVFVLREKYYFTVLFLLAFAHGNAQADKRGWQTTASGQSQLSTCFYTAGEHRLVVTFLNVAGENKISWHGSCRKFQFQCLHKTFHWKIATYFCFSPIYHFFSGYNGHNNSCHRDLKDYKDEDIYYQTFYRNCIWWESEFLTL